MHINKTAELILPNFLINFEKNIIGFQILG